MMMNIFKSTLKVHLRMSSNYEQKEFMCFEYKSLFRHVICKSVPRDSGFFFHIHNTYAQSEIFFSCLLYLLEILSLYS